MRNSVLDSSRRPAQAAQARRLPVRQRNSRSSQHDSEKRQSVSQSVSQSVIFFTVPPRAHPSTGSQSGSAAPGLTQVPSKNVSSFSFGSLHFNGEGTLAHAKRIQQLQAYLGYPCRAMSLALSCRRSAPVRALLLPRKPVKPLVGAIWEYDLCLERATDEYHDHLGRDPRRRTLLLYGHLHLDPISLPRPQPLRGGGEAV